MTVRADANDVHAEESKKFWSKLKWQKIFLKSYLSLHKIFKRGLICRKYSVLHRGRKPQIHPVDWLIDWIDWIELNWLVDWLIDWLIDWLVFYVISAISWPFNDNPLSQKRSKSPDPIRRRLHMIYLILWRKTTKTTHINNTN